MANVDQYHFSLIASSSMDADSEDGGGWTETRVFGSELDYEGYTSLATGNPESSGKAVSKPLPPLPSKDEDIHDTAHTTNDTGNSTTGTEPPSADTSLFLAQSDVSEALEEFDLSAIQKQNRARDPDDSMRVSFDNLLSTSSSLASDIFGVGVNRLRTATQTPTGSPLVMNSNIDALATSVNQMNVQDSPALPANSQKNVAPSENVQEMSLMDTSISSAPLNIPIATYADATNIANMHPELAQTVLTISVPYVPPSLSTASMLGHTDEQPNWALADPDFALADRHGPVHTQERPNWALASIEPDEDPKPKEHPRKPSPRKRTPKRNSTSRGTGLPPYMTDSGSGTGSGNQEYDYRAAYDYGLDYGGEAPTPPYMRSLPGSGQSHSSSQRGSRFQNKQLPPVPIPAYDTQSGYRAAAHTSNDTRVGSTSLDQWNEPAPSSGGASGENVDAWMASPAAADQWNEPAPPRTSGKATAAPGDSVGAWTGSAPAAHVWEGSGAETTTADTWIDPTSISSGTGTTWYPWSGTEPPHLKADAWMTDATASSPSRVSDRGSRAPALGRDNDYTSASAPSQVNDRSCHPPSHSGRDDYTVPPHMVEDDGWTGSLPASAYGALNGSRSKRGGGRKPRNSGSNRGGDNRNSFSPAGYDAGQRVGGGSGWHQSDDLSDEWTGSLPASAYGASRPKRRGGYAGGYRREEPQERVYEDCYDEPGDEWTGSLPASAYGASSSSKHKGRSRKDAGDHMNDCGGRPSRRSTLGYDTSPEPHAGQREGREASFRGGDVNWASDNGGHGSSETAMWNGTQVNHTWDTNGCPPSASTSANPEISKSVEPSSESMVTYWQNVHDAWATPPPCLQPEMGWQRPSPSPVHVNTELNVQSSLSPVSVDKHAEHNFFENSLPPQYFSSAHSNSHAGVGNARRLSQVAGLIAATQKYLAPSPGADNVMKFTSVSVSPIGATGVADAAKVPIPESATPSSAGYSPEPFPQRQGRSLIRTPPEEVVPWRNNRSNSSSGNELCTQTPSLPPPSSRSAAASSVPDRMNANNPCGLVASGAPTPPPHVKESGQFLLRNAPQSLNTPPLPSVSKFADSLDRHLLGMKAPTDVNLHSRVLTPEAAVALEKGKENMTTPVIGKEHVPLPHECDCA